MSERMFIVRRPGCDLVADEGKDAGNAVGEIVYGIGQYRCRTRRDSRNELYRKQDNIAYDSDNAGQKTIGKTHIETVRFLCILYKRSNQPLRHNNYIL